MFPIERWFFLSLRWLHKCRRKPIECNSMKSIRNSSAAPPQVHTPKQSKHMCIFEAQPNAFSRQHFGSESFVRCFATGNLFMDTCERSALCQLQEERKQASIRSIEKEHFWLTCFTALVFRCDLIASNHIKSSPFNKSRTIFIWASKLGKKHCKHPLIGSESHGSERIQCCQSPIGIVRHSPWHRTITVASSPHICYACLFFQLLKKQVLDFF